MRLPLLVAALAAAAATALPAHAAFYPVCATRLELAPAGATRECTSGNNPFARSTRTMNVVVASGAVDATLTCHNYPYADSTATRRVYAGQRVAFSVSERGGSCVARLASLAAGTSAAATSTFTPVLVQEPTP